MEKITTEKTDILTKFEDFLRTKTDEKMIKNLKNKMNIDILLHMYIFDHFNPFK